MSGGRVTAAAFDTATPVLVLKIGSYPLHHGGLGVIRSLGRVGVPVYGVCEDRFTPAAVSRYLRGRFIWATSGDESCLLDDLEAIAGRIGRRAVLVPTDDEAAILVAEHAATLREWFAFPEQPPALPRSLASKRGLYQTCVRLGVPCPEAAFPTSEADVVDFCARAAFPIVLKGVEPWLLTRRTGQKSTSIVRGPDDLLAIWRRLEGRAGGHLMLQEYIPDGVGEDWIVHGYCDARSTCLAAFTGVKLRSYPPHAGLTTLGRTAANPVLLEQAEALFERLSYRGIMDMDWRLDRRDGRYKLLDFNPRLGAQFRLFEDDHGIDVVRALHLDLTGRRLPQGRLVQRRGFVVEHLDTLAALGYRRDGGLTVRGWIRSLRGVQERAWFALDDLVPFAVLCGRFLLRGAARALKVERPAGVRRARAPRFLAGRARLSVVPGRLGGFPSRRTSDDQRTGPE